MQITCINNGTTPVPMPGDVVCAAGATKTVTARTQGEYAQFLENWQDENSVIIFGELEDADQAPLICSMKTPSDASGGATTIAAEGFDLEDEAGNAIPATPQMYLGVFDDDEFTTPATNATLDTAAAGTIVSGAGTALLVVTPSATGEVSVTLTDAVDETVYLKAWPVSSGRVIDCSDSHDSTFSA